MARTLDDIYPKLYYAERMVRYFKENYFPQDSESFGQDKKAKEEFVYDYEQMEAQLYAISELLFDVRVQAEFALGVKSVAVEAHIRNEAEMEAQL
ncbi:MAG: hypothetical protein LKJ45_05310 [Oscillospiraceae bacterium]|jgi:hypothetical protein|nr:hypothetical protein [Oscillospiraceae bacterium]